MKDLLHEFCRESVYLLKRYEHGQPAEHLARGLTRLTIVPFDRQLAVRYAVSALHEVVLNSSGGKEKSGAQVLRDLLPSELTDTMAMVIEYVHEHMQRETAPNRAEAEFIYSVTCSICTFTARMVESRKCGDKPQHTGEEAWRERSWVRHSLTATIEDKISSLRPSRAATQAELFADLGIDIEGELPIDREIRNHAALRKIRAIMSGSVTSFEHISDSSDKSKGTTSYSNKQQEDDESYHNMGVSLPFSPVIASMQNFLRCQGRHQRAQDKELSSKSLCELRRDANESELLYSIGCAMCAFLMATFIDSYR